MLFFSNSDHYFKEDVLSFLYILKDFKNAPPAKMLIYCQNVIFQLCEK